MLQYAKLPCNTPPLNTHITNLQSIRAKISPHTNHSGNHCSLPKPIIIAIINLYLYPYWQQHHISPSHYCNNSDKLCNIKHNQAQKHPSALSKFHQTNRLSHHTKL